MTKSTISHRSQDVSDYLRQTSLSDTALAPAVEETGIKTPSDPAILAQQLASESSWAERYVPSTPSESVMTPSASSVAGHSEAAQSRSVVGESDYTTMDEAPPTYELATSESGVRSPGAGSHASGALPQIHTPLPPFSQPRPHEQPAQSSQAESSQLIPQQSGEQRPFIPSRRYSRHETSSSINGTFTLHDSLDLSTTSGSISIKLDVKPGPNPAILKLKSKSGSIRVDDKQCDTAQSHRHSRGAGNCPRQDRGPGLLSSLFGWGKRPAEVEAPPMPVPNDPRKQAGQGPHSRPQEQQVQELPAAEEPEELFTARAIHATIETSSGSANAQFVLTAGSDLRITTSSGSINLRLVTSGSGSGARPLSKLEMEDSRNAQLSSTTDLSSNLMTQTGSGSQSVSISAGITDTSDGAIVSACRASHKSTGSGGVNVHYPREWIGLVHASVGGSGSTRVSGSGLEYDKRGNYEVYAWRGVVDPDLSKAVEVRCDNSGSVGFSC